MQVGNEGLDLLARIRVRETILMGLITLTAVLANLPEHLVRRTGVDPDFLVAVLACAVMLGLFLYLKFFLFLAVVLLTAGANMPDQIAEGLNVSKVPILLALVALVGIALINYVIKALPTGLEPKPRTRSLEGVRAMFYAIDRNNVPYARKVLAMRFDPNMASDNGFTPLAYAAMRGNPDMVQLFLRNGADPAFATRDGDTPVELALRFGHTEVAEQLRSARISASAAPAT